MSRINISFYEVGKFTKKMYYINIHNDNIIWTELIHKICEEIPNIGAYHGYIKINNQNILFGNILQTQLITINDEITLTGFLNPSPITNYPKWLNKVFKLKLEFPIFQIEPISLLNINEYNNSDEMCENTPRYIMGIKKNDNILWINKKGIKCKVFDTNTDIYNSPLTESQQLLILNVNDRSILPIVNLDTLKYELPYPQE